MLLLHIEDAIGAAGPLVPSSRLENLPLDIAYCILDVIATFADLKSLSLVSKTINQLVNTRLWKCVVISDRAEATGQLRRATINNACQTILRDARRAKCVQDLTVRWTSTLDNDETDTLSSPAPSASIERALSAVTNLTTLRIRYDNSGGNEIIDALLANRHSFRLHTFEFDALPGTGVQTFLEAQPTIETYRVRDNRDIRRLQSIDAPVSDVRDRPALLPLHILPSLRRFWYSGHSDCIRYTLRGRKIPTLECSPTNINYDLDRLSAIPPDSDPSSSSFEEDASRDDSDKNIVTNISVDIDGARDRTHIFPDVISSLYSVSLAHIQSLKITSQNVPLNANSFVTTISQFPALEWLEVDYGDESHLARSAALVEALSTAAPLLRRVVMCGLGSSGLVQIFSRENKYRKEDVVHEEANCQERVCFMCETRYFVLPFYFPGHSSRWIRTLFSKQEPLPGLNWELTS